MLGNHPVREVDILNASGTESRLPALVDLTCRKVCELMGAYLSVPGLGARDRARLEQHLYACVGCMDYLQQLERTRLALASLRRGEVAVPESALLAAYRDAAGIVGSARPRGAYPPPRVRPRGEPRRRAGRRLERMRYAFKFLASGSRGPISRHAWPLPSNTQPGAWVEVTGRLEPCRVGVHACAPEELACWLHDTLWLVELDGDVQRCVCGVVATRGRLVRAVDGWQRGCAARFAQAAYDHASALARASALDRQMAAAPCIAWAARQLPRACAPRAAYCAAMAVARLRGVSHFDQNAYDAERRWQSRWIARELRLDDVLAQAGAQAGSVPT
ncbi:MAG: hypothetical protein ABW252_26560 [Polyangiales bacterium]